MHTLSFKYEYFVLMVGLTLCMLIKGKSQNLISNPGFEKFAECPNENFNYSDALGWYTHIPAENQNFEWHERAYIHACDPLVMPWWDAELEDALIRTMYAYDVTAEISYTRLIWTELNAPLAKGDLYYLEYTTSPSILYFPQDETIALIRNVPTSLGIKWEDESFQGDITDLTPMEPDMIASGGAYGQLSPNTLQIGNCFEATGNEKYLLYGFFLDDTPIEDYSYIRPSSNVSIPIKWPIFSTDNFKLEKMKIELCCDTTVCAHEVIDFSRYVDSYIIPKKQIIWSDGVQGVKRSFSTSGAYRFRLNTNCGSLLSNWLEVEVEDCQLKVYTPNAFTPNGDAINPYFIPLFSDELDLTDMNFSIVNRWGRTVFQTKDLNSRGWDGKVKGIDALEGAYVWHMEFSYRLGEEIITETQVGSLLLIR
ncbi:MAG: gliding motility-associated C-terminal domain-containing protein [Bacteroidota bacterium]